MDGETASKIDQALRSAPLFARVSPKTLQMLVQSSRLLSVSEGCAIFLRFDPAEAAYVVSQGKVQISLASVDGRQIVINEMVPGDCFGELGLITGEAHSADAIAGPASELVAIPRDVFLRALDLEPPLTRLLLDTTARRLSSSSEFESSLAFYDAQTRLARLLLDLDQAREKHEDILISQVELADRTGLIRQTVAKALGGWRRAGWLSTGRGKVRLLDRRALERWLLSRGD